MIRERSTARDRLGELSGPEEEGRSAHLPAGRTDGHGGAALGDREEPDTHHPLKVEPSQIGQEDLPENRCSRGCGKQLPESRVAPDRPWRRQAPSSRHRQPPPPIDTLVGRTSAADTPTATKRCECVARHPWSSAGARLPTVPHARCDVTEVECHPRHVPRIQPASAASMSTSCGPWHEPSRRSFPAWLRGARSSSTTARQA